MQSGVLVQSPCGMRNSKAKLRDADIPIIRRLYAEGLKQHDIAAMFGVSSGMISHITVGRSWKHIP